MPRTDPIGEVENPDDTDFGPLVIPVVGYKLDGTRVDKDLQFRPQFPPGGFLAMVRSADDSGVIGQAAILDYLDSCLLPESRDNWDFIMYDKDTNFSQQTVLAVYKKLAEHYAGGKFPTKQPPALPNGSPRAKRTTSAAASGPASTGKARR